MFKKFFLLITMSLFSMTPSYASESSKNAYDFVFTELTKEEPMPLSKYKGKVILIVNTASHCGFTSQYEGLQKLYETYSSKGLIIIGVPSNDFGKQEPGNNKEIANFCKFNYGVSFPMTSKEVVSGSKAHPFYLWSKSQLGFGSAPKWNFHKYLVNRHGDLVDYFNSNTSPDSPRLINAVNKFLDEK